MDIFEPHQRDENISHWVPLHHHHITAAVEDWLIRTRLSEHH